MDKAESQEVRRDLERYKDEIREIKYLIIELEARITLDTIIRRRHE